MNVNLMNIHDALLWLTLDSIGMYCLTSTHHPLTVWSEMASWVPRARCCHPPERHPQADFHLKKEDICQYNLLVWLKTCKYVGHMKNIQNILKNSPHAEQKPLGPI